MRDHRGGLLEAMGPLTCSLNNESDNFFRVKAVRKLFENIYVVADADGASVRA